MKQIARFNLNLNLKTAGKTASKCWPDLHASPLVLQLLVCLLSASIAPVQACHPVHFNQSSEQLVCKCDLASAQDVASSCQADLVFEWPRDGGTLVRVVSSRAGKRFHADELRLGPTEAGGPPLAHHNGDATDEPSSEADQLVVELDVNRRQQRIVGFGGAFTDSASQLLRELPGELRARLLASYFGPHGLAYNLARVPIGGTDMSTRPYSCNDLAEGEHDFQLAKFSLQREDLSFKLPLIREAARLVRKDHRTNQSEHHRLRLLFSAWSAPNWMKTNHSLVQGQLKLGQGGPTAGPPTVGAYYDAYARYILKFIESYERELYARDEDAVQCWALTPQNEPCTPSRLGYQVVNYNSVNFDPKQLAAYLNDHLVPQLLKHNRTGSKKLALFVWDDTLLGLDKYKSSLMGAAMSPQVYDYVRGLAVHWYSQGLDKLPYKSLYETRRWLPDKFSLLSTEASFIGRPRPGDWSRGLRYARDIIENLRVGAVGWLDWNLALDLSGGPTWSSNFLDSALLVDQARQVAYKQPMFYAIGHVSRFLRAGGHVLPSQVFSLRPGEGAKTAKTSSYVDEARAKNRTASGKHRPASSFWKMIDEDEEQTSELLVAAAELEPTSAAANNWRQIGLVLLNRANRTLSVRLNLANCRGGPPAATSAATSAAALALNLDLEPESITSLALNC